MGGGGSIQGMLNSLKYNRGQLRRHRKTFKELAKKYPAKNKGVDLKKASPSDLRVIRLLIQARRKRTRIRNGIFIGILSFLGVWFISTLF